MRVKTKKTCACVFCTDLFSLKTNDGYEPKHRVKSHSTEKPEWQSRSDRLAVYFCIYPQDKPESSSWLQRHHRRSNYWLTLAPCRQLELHFQWIEGHYVQIWARKQTEIELIDWERQTCRETIFYDARLWPEINTGYRCFVVGSFACRSTSSLGLWANKRTIFQVHFHNALDFSDHVT